MRKGILKKCTVLAMAIGMMLTVTSCIHAGADMRIARNGKAAISAVVMMDDESVKEVYGMPTNFYDAVESDFRYSRTSTWEQTYISETIDGKNYIGVSRNIIVPKKDIQKTLNDIYGDYAKVTYSDKNVFGTRKISIKFSSNGNRLIEDELVAATHDQVISELKVTVPGTIKSTNATQLGSNQVSISTLDLVCGKEANLDYEVKFFDFTFFIPIVIGVAVAVAAAIVVTTKLKKIKKQNEGLTSINLKNIKKKPAKSSLGGGGIGGGDDMDDFMSQKSKKPAFKKTPKYTSESTNTQTTTPAAPVQPETPAPAPAYKAPKAPSFTAPKAPVAPQAPVQEEPAAPAYEETAYAEPAYTEPAYTEPEPVVEETPSYSVGTAKASRKGGTQEYTYQAGSLRAEEEKEEPMAPYTASENSFFIPKAEYERNGMENQTHEDVDYGGYRKKFSASAPSGTSSAASSKMSSTTSGSESGYVAGSAKFSKSQGSSALPSGSTLFQPRSTAPNLEYFTPGYQTEQKPADNVQPLEHGDTIFQPRSTAPNMDYFMPGHHEEQKPAENVTQFTTGDTVFQPRSTAPNLNYGKDVKLPEDHDPGNPDPFKKKEGTEHSSLFTPRSTAPNLEYGKPKDDFSDLPPVPKKESAPSFLSKKSGTATSSSQSSRVPSAPQRVPAAPKPAAPAYGQSSYGQSSYGQSSYEDNTQSGYAQDDSYGYSYSDASYSDSYDDGSYNGSYGDSSYADSSSNYGGGYYDQSAEQSSGGSIYQTEGYETSSYQSASVGVSHKSEAISGAYGGSKLGSGAYLGGSATGTKIGRSVGNIGGYVDPEMVNTSSYGSDPFAGAPLPKLGESGADGGGLFSYDANGGFGGNTNTIDTSRSFGGSAIGSGTFGSSKYSSGSSYSQGGTQFTSQSGTKFGSGSGTGRFDFGKPSSGNRKCPFCKEPIRDDDTFCVACGAELSRPYGSF